MRRGRRRVPRARHRVAPEGPRARPRHLSAPRCAAALPRAGRSQRLSDSGQDSRTCQFPSEHAFEHRLTLVRGANVDGGALTRLLMRSLRLPESVFERGCCRDGLSQGGAEVRFAPAETLGRGSGVCPASLSRRIEGSRCATQFSGERITRPRRLRQTRRELHVPLRPAGRRKRRSLTPAARLPPRARSRARGVSAATPRRSWSRAPGTPSAGPGRRRAVRRGCRRVRSRSMAASHCSGQVSLERGVGHHVSVGAGIECGERRLKSRRSRHDDDWRRQAKPAQFLDERGAALRLHLDDDGRGVAVALQPRQSGSRCLGPARA